MPYRPPELFEGGVRAGDPDLDYRKVDAWSLGCTLFALLYGASPAEAEFITSGRSVGKLRVVECSQLKVIGPVPRPPPGSPVADWYSPNTHQVIEDMLIQDRHQRPELSQVLERLEHLILDLGGAVEPEISSRRAKNYQDNVDDDGIALLSTNRLI
jgi:serine/threonine kinase 16